MEVYVLIGTGAFDYSRDDIDAIEGVFSTEEGAIQVVKRLMRHKLWRYAGYNIEVYKLDEGECVTEVSDV